MNPSSLRPVLIVDDSLTVRMDLQEALEGAGLECRLCDSLAAARDVIGRQTFGAILLDVLLPDGDGIDLLQELKETASTAAIPVLLLSSETDVADRVRGMRTGADDYVGKPYDRVYVIARVEEFLRQQTAPDSGRPPTVLVIDDSLTFREMLGSALQEAGYRVLLCGNGEEGLRLIAASRPDLAVVDAHLPGIDGLSVVRQLKLDAALRRTPCLLLTADDTANFELAALEAGADGFVRKDSGAAVITSRLSAALRRARPSAGIDVDSLFGPKRVLAVDDSPTYLQELAARIRQEGHEVIQAFSGEEALELLAVQPVDCILLDLVMPGLSGQETCVRIKATPQWREIPLIMLTACEDSDVMVEALNAGADDYIVKSGDFEIVRARLRAQIRRKYFEDENRKIRDELARKERETTEARAAQQLAETKAALTVDLQRVNAELEAFSYSVSHDLRAPLRNISAFAVILNQKHSGQLGPDGSYLLDKIQDAALRMETLIGDLIRLSQVNAASIARDIVDLSAVARKILADLGSVDSGRMVDCIVEDGLVVHGDEKLIRAALENLLGNAWKYTSHRQHARVVLDTLPGKHPQVFRVKDNGAGFDQAYSEKLFKPFQRLHTSEEFEGTGIGLATVQRIIHRHGGEIWAEGAVGEGAVFYFTLERYTSLPL